MLRLNLLDGPFAEQDASRIGTLLLSVEDPQDGTRAEATLLVSRDLRGKLREAHALIYDDLEDDEVSGGYIGSSACPNWAWKRKPASWNRA